MRKSIQAFNHWDNYLEEFQAQTIHLKVKHNITLSKKFVCQDH